MKKLILAVPGLLLCGLIWLLPVENTHYGFKNPGMRIDSITIIVVLCVLAIGYALTTLFFRHNNKHDFAFPYVALFLVIAKLIQIIILFLSYY